MFSAAFWERKGSRAYGPSAGRRSTTTEVTQAGVTCDEPCVFA